MTLLICKILYVILLFDKYVIYQKLTQNHILQIIHINRDFKRENGTIKYFSVNNRVYSSVNYNGFVNNEKLFSY